MPKGGRRNAKARGAHQARETDRAAAAGVPPLAPVPGRSASGRAGRMLMEGYGRDAANVALDARAARMGWAKPKTGNDVADAHAAAKARRRARVQSLEGYVGELLHATVFDGEERQRLWNAWDGLTRARLAYHRRILGIDPLVRTTRLALLPEPVETRPDDGPADLRTEQERDEAAAASWDAWRRRLRRIDGEERVALLDAVADVRPLLGPPNAQGKRTPNEAGGRVLAGLRALDARAR